jgi:hypothetical protein
VISPCWLYTIKQITFREVYHKSEKDLELQTCCLLIEIYMEEADKMKGMR